MAAALRMFLPVVWLLSSCTPAPSANGGVESRRAPERIVSLAPGLTELVFALGAGDRLVGSTTACDTPKAAQALSRVGDFGTVGHEAILGRTPDLVLAVDGAVDSRMVVELNAMGIVTQALPMGTIAEIRSTIQRIGELLHVSENARRLLRGLESDWRRLGDAHASLRPVRTLLVLGARPLHVVSPKSFAGELLEAAGGLNVVSSEGPAYPTWTLEQVVAARPEVILLTRMSGATPALFESWSSIPAVRDGRVHVLTQDDQVLRPGPRLAEGAEILAGFLHPASRKPGEAP